MFRGTPCIYFDCLFVRLHPTSIKTAKTNGFKFCDGPHMTPKKVFGASKLENNTGKWLYFFFNAPRQFEKNPTID